MPAKTSTKVEKVQKVRAETSPKDESSKPKKTSEAEGEGDGEADAEEASQSGSEERTTIEQVRAKKAARARYMRFSRSLKSKSRWDIHGLQLRSGTPQCIRTAGQQSFRSILGALDRSVPLI